MSTAVRFRPLGNFRTVTPLVGLTVGGPLATAYVIVVNPAMLDRQNVFAFGHVVLCLVLGGIMLIASKREREFQKPMITTGSVMLAVGGLFFWLEYSPELWRSLAISALLCWFIRWLFVNQRAYDHRFRQELQQLHDLALEAKILLPDATGVEDILNDPAPTTA